MEWVGFGCIEQVACLGKVATRVVAHKDAPAPRPQRMRQVADCLPAGADNNVITCKKSHRTDTSRMCRVMFCGGQAIVGHVRVMMHLCI